MDKLQEIIQTLSEESSKHFCLFIHRQKQKSGRKDLTLFRLMREGRWTLPQEYMTQLYGYSNPNAYHALRKRLFQHLTRFLILFRMDHDNTSGAQVMGSISLVRYLFEQKNDRLAWYYLKKAENTAIENEQYDLLNLIYGLQIVHADSEFAPDLKGMAEKREKYRAKGEVEERASLAFSLIKQRLREVKLKSKKLDFEKIISNVLCELKLEGILYHEPRHLYHLLTITRSAILANKDFYSFEPYIIAQYKVMEHQGAFTKANHFYKLNTLYMLCHVLYRNRKFGQASLYLGHMATALEEFGRVFFKKFHVKYIMLLSGVKSYLGESSTAISLLENLIAHCQYLKEEERLGALLNLGLYYFQQGDLKQANRINLRIGHTDHWCQKKMGREWLMKKNLMEIIVQYELGNSDIVKLRLKVFHRQYKDLYPNPIYNRVSIYTGFITDLVDRPDCIMDKEYEAKIITALTQTPEEKEDLQAMTFYSWLKSKFLQKAFYTTLLETVA